MDSRQRGGSDSSKGVNAKLFLGEFHPGLHFRTAAGDDQTARLVDTASKLHGGR